MALYFEGATGKNMTRNTPRRPGDVTQRAKLIVDLSTGAIAQKDIDALPLMGREISGQARNAAVPMEKRREWGRKGAQVRAQKRAAKLATQ